MVLLRVQTLFEIALITLRVASTSATSAAANCTAAGPDSSIGAAGSGVITGGSIYRGGGGGCNRGYVRRGYRGRLSTKPEARPNLLDYFLRFQLLGICHKKSNRVFNYFLSICASISRQIGNKKTASYSPSLSISKILLTTSITSASSSGATGIRSKRP
jgi:hypothetical protein